MVLKPQNLPAQFHLLVDSLPVQGCSSICNLFMELYITDPSPGMILEAIWMNNRLNGTLVVDCIDPGGWIKCWGRIYTPEEDQLWLQLIQQHHNTVLSGALGWAKTFYLRDWLYYWKEMWNEINQYVPNCHSCQRSWSLQHSTIAVHRPFPVP